MQITVLGIHLAKTCSISVWRGRVPVYGREPPRCRSCGHRERRELRRSDGRGCLIAVALDDPALVVGLLERVEGQAQVLDGVEATHPKQILLQRANEALDAARCPRARARKRASSRGRGRRARLDSRRRRTGCRDRGEASGHGRSPRRRHRSRRGHPAGSARAPRRGVARRAAWIPIIRSNSGRRRRRSRPAPRCSGSRSDRCPTFRPRARSGSYRRGPSDHAAGQRGPAPAAHARG
jgi:hypothetical protein